MKRLTIGLDIDGVIVDFTTAALPLLSEVCNRPVSPGDLSHYDLKECLGIDEKTDDYFWKRVLGTDFMLNAPPVSGALDGMSALCLHELRLVTGRPPAMRDITERWLEKQDVKYDSLIFTATGSKASQGSDCDIFVEDFLEEVQRIAESGVFTLLFNQPWNQALRLPENCRRVYDWEDIVAIVRDLSE